MKVLDVEASGGCQCGAIRYHAKKMLDNAHLCHCRMCQKAVGNLFAALVATPNSALEWTRGEPAIFKSSAHIERGFCTECGTPLYYNDLENDRINLTIGSLDTPKDFPPVRQFGMEARLSCIDDLSDLDSAGETGSGEFKIWARAIAETNRQHPDHDTDRWP